MTEKGIAWRGKGEAAEVWVGKGRADIFGYFEKLEKPMVWSGLWPLSKTHQRGMSKVREDGIPGQTGPGLGRARLGHRPAGPGAAASVLKAAGCASLFRAAIARRRHTKILCICDCLCSTTGGADLVISV